MVIKSEENALGAWAFLIGVILAIAFGILGNFLEILHIPILAIMIILGLILGFGFVNVSSKDLNTFLMVTVSLVIVSFAGTEAVNDIRFLTLDIGGKISSTLGTLLVMLVPATIVVAIKSLFSIARK